MTDYYISAMIRVSEHHHWRLWSARVQAPTMREARTEALLLIDGVGCYHGEMHILTAEAPIVLAQPRAILAAV